MRTIRDLLSAGLALAFMPALATADSLVKWGDSAANVTAITAGQGLASGVVPYSTDTARSPASGYTGTSATFYGGAVATGTQSGINVWQVQDNYANLGGLDAFTFRVSSADIGAAGYALQVWKQADFSSLSTGNVAVTDFSVDARIAGGGIAGEMRFYIVSNGVTLVSAAQSFNSTAASTISLSNLSAASWFLYDPSVSLSVIGSAYDTTGFAFDKVTSVGLLVKQERISGAVANMSAFWNNVSINGVAVSAVPEPSSFALLAGLAGLGHIAFRRRHVRR